MSLAFIFLNLFVLTSGSMLLVLRYQERVSRRKIATVLHVGEKKQEIAIDLLKELEAEGDTAGSSGLSLNIGQRLEELLQHADLNWPVARLVRLMAFMGLIGIAAGAIYPVILNRPTSALAFGVVGAYLPYMHVKRTRNKRLDRLEKQLPEAMDFLARSMRAGNAFSISLGLAGDGLQDPLGREFRTLFNERNLGAPIDVAFGNFNRRIPLNDVKLFCSAAILQQRTGGNFAEILTRLSDIVRDRFRLRGQVKAASAHGRMTAGILAVLPLLTTAALMFAAPDYLKSMWDDRDGKILVGAAVGTQLLGNFFIHKITNITV